jgi:hypothetical protein
MVDALQRRVGRLHRVSKSTPRPHIDVQPRRDYGTDLSSRRVTFVPLNPLDQRPETRNRHLVTCLVVLAEIDPTCRRNGSRVLETSSEAATRAGILGQSQYPDLGLSGRIEETAAPVDNECDLARVESLDLQQVTHDARGLMPSAIRKDDRDYWQRISSGGARLRRFLH